VNQKNLDRGSDFNSSNSAIEKCWVENHILAIALHTVYSNFLRVSKLRVSPAMAAALQIGFGRSRKS